MDYTQIWWLVLALEALVTVVVAVLLGLVIAAAKSIDHNAAGIWLVGKEIAGNTVAIWTLEATTEKLDAAKESVKKLEQTAASLNDNLRTLAGRR